MNLPAKAASGDIMESVLIKGDLAKLTEMERVNYYNAVCKSIGLNPLTRPFDYITLNGKLQLYAKRDACDQLRRIQNISLAVISTETNDEIFTVHVKAKTPEGREDEDFGAVFLPTRITGEIRANLILKAVTKAKRRATLSICGLGFLDETEVEDIPSAAPGRKFINPSSRNVMQAAQPEGGAAMAQKPLAQDLDDEIPDFTAVESGGEAPPVFVATKPPLKQKNFADAASSAEGAAAVAPSAATGGADLKLQLLYSVARAEAMKGDAALQAWFKTRTNEEKEELRKIRNELKALYPK